MGIVGGGGVVYTDTSQDQKTFFSKNVYPTGETEVDAVVDGLVVVSGGEAVVALHADTNLASEPPFWKQKLIADPTLNRIVKKDIQ
jgi:hypothetical protein